MSLLNRPSSLPPAACRRARVIGIGKAGVEMALALRDLSVAGLEFAAIDTDASAVESCPLPEKLFVGARLTRGLGLGGDPDLARAAADEEAPAIRAFCQEVSMIFILAGLGGGSGTGVAPVVARVARESGVSVFAFVTAPFECEGSRRWQQAAIGIRRLKTVADGVLCLPDEGILKLTTSPTPLLDAFRFSRELVAEAARCVWSLLTQPGLLNVSFADICALLHGPNLESAYARVEAAGPGRAASALEALLKHPFIEGGESLRRAESVLVSLNAGPDLTVGEINEIMSPINLRCDGARVVVGATVDEANADRLTLTVITSTRQTTLAGGAESASATVPEVPLDLAHAPEPSGASRTAGKFVAPPPALSPEETSQLYFERNGNSRRRRPKLEQTHLSLVVTTRGRFEKCEPTVRGGHNLDQPTYLRRGIPLN